MKEFETDIKKLKNFLKEKLHKNNVRYIGSGWSSHVFKDEECIYRFPKQNLEDYLFEKSVCEKLENTFSFLLPRIQLETDGEYPYSIHESIVGYTLKEKQECFDDITLVKDCALALSQIHALKLDNNVREVPTDTKPDYKKMEEKLLYFFTMDSVKEMCHIYQKSREYYVDEQVFTHGDFYPGNLIVNEENKLVGVIDWCNSGIDMRHNDFRFLFLCMSESQFAILCEEYERLSGKTIQPKRIRELALADLMERIYWCQDNKKIEQIYIKKMRDYYHEFVFKKTEEK